MVAGQFIWHDLNTRDAEAARAFYEGLFGWTLSRIQQTPAGPYPVLHDGGSELGGLLTMDASWGERPAHWAPYLQVVALDAALATVREAGGGVVFGPLPIPGTGRFAQVVDDQGVTVYLLEVQEDPPQAAGPTPGRVCGHGLLAEDVDAAQRFWCAVAGWTAQSLAAEDGHPQTLFALGGTPVAGMRRVAPGEAPGWGCVVAVASLEASCAQALEAGATEVGAPRDVGTFGRIVTIVDPEGASISLFEAAIGSEDGAGSPVTP